VIARDASLSRETNAETWRPGASKFSPNFIFEPSGNINGLRSKKFGKPLLARLRLAKPGLRIRAAAPGVFHRAAVNQHAMEKLECPETVSSKQKEVARAALKGKVPRLACEGVDDEQANVGVR
jgi:hypothetical protein